MLLYQRYGICSLCQGTMMGHKSCSTCMVIAIELWICGYQVVTRAGSPQMLWQLMCDHLPVRAMNAKDARIHAGETPANMRLCYLHLLLRWFEEQMSCMLSCPSVWVWWCIESKATRYCPLDCKVRCRCPLNALCNCTFT